MREIRLELGLSLRAVAQSLGMGHSVIHKFEEQGFLEPPWAKFVKIYGDHPDIRTSASPMIDMGRVDFLNKSRLYSSLMAMYGRAKLPDILDAKTNKEVLEELGEKCREFCWKESDLECIKVRIGLKQILRAGRKKVSVKE